MNWIEIIIGTIIVIAIYVLVEWSRQQAKRKPKSLHREPKLQIKNTPLFRIDRNVLSITSHDFVGWFSRSPNDKYILTWTEGRCFLIEDSRIVFRKRLQRPDHGKVSDNGNSIIADYTLSDELAGVFYVFSSTGEALFRKRFRAIPYDTGISDEGHYAVSLVAGSSYEPHDGLLCLFDLTQKKMLTKFKAPRCWPNGYRFEPHQRVLHLLYDDGLDLRYSFDGELLDPEKWKTERASERARNISGYELFDLAEDRLEKLGGSELSAYSEVIDLFGRAIQRGVSENYQARTHRILGEIYHRCNDNSNALKHFEEALRFNPKIGVKKLVKKLRALNP